LLSNGFSNKHVPTEITDRIGVFCALRAEVIENRENEHVRSIGQGEARHKKYKKLNFGGGQAYDRSNDKAAVVA
jgi:hypothetical protein